jgi:hypothetical protein
LLGYHCQRLVALGAQTMLLSHPENPGCFGALPTVRLVDGCGDAIGLPW